MQEALARAWEREGRGEHIDSLPAWVTRVSVNLTRSRLRRLRAESRAKDKAGRNRRPTEDPDTRIDVRRALSELPRRQREVTVLRYYLGLDIAEIAASLGVSQGTVKTSLSRARATLAEALELEEGEDDRAWTR